jgi:nitrate/nitrite-specific signal transduction histidine kinase
LWQIGLADLATAVVLVGLMMLALGKFVVRPVRELARGADEIGGGNLDHPVRLASQDELGNLARTFDAMRQRLKESLAGLERRNRELSVLNDVALAASQLLDLQQIFDLALDTVVNQLGMQAGAIYLRDEDTGRLAQRACLGLSEAQCQEIERLRGQSGGDISQHVVETGAVTFVADMAGEDRFQGFWDDMRGRSYVNIPLKSKGAVVGTMGLVTYAGQPLTGREVEVLKAVGHEIGTAIDNASLLAETRRGKGEAENLYRLGTRISASLVLGQVLDAVAEAARQVLAADLGVVGLLDAAGREVSVQAAAGASTEILRDLRIPVGKAGLASGRPLIIEECSPDLPIAHAQALMAAEGVVSLLVVPLEHRGRLLGLVGVMTRQRRRFTVHDVQLLTRLGHQVVVAIENARLYRQVRRLAILEERDRLAREMHDHLAQGLGYLTIRASILSEVVAGRKTDRIQAGLVELRQIANEIYSDVRADIFNLRSADLSDFGFLPALREYLNEYRAHHSLEVELVIDSDSLAFAPDVEVQLLHIIQEALANVRKHAQASHVWVRFEQQDPLLHITVEDDGRGFDPARLGAEGGWYFGLQIMRERAESIGGSLELDSSPSQGTQVRVYIPYPTEK